MTDARLSLGREFIRLRSVAGAATPQKIGGLALLAPGGSTGAGSAGGV